MYSRYSDVSLKNDMWRKIWIRDIEGILMILNKKIRSRKMEPRKEFPRIEPLTSGVPHSNLDLELDFFARNSRLKYMNIVNRYSVLMHKVTSYYDILCHKEKIYIPQSLRQTTNSTVLVS
jgi:hypothetical protein